MARYGSDRLQIDPDREPYPTVPRGVARPGGVDTRASVRETPIMRGANGSTVRPAPRLRLAWALLLIAATIAAIYWTVERRYVEEQIELNLEVADAAVALTRARLELLGPVEARGDEVFAGDVRLNGSTELVDRILGETGFGCTLFRRDVRIATTARAANDTWRAVGTRANPEIARRVYEDGQVFRGITRTIGKDWVIVYVPWYDARARRIGMLAAFRELDDFDRDLWRFRGLLGGTLLALFVMLAILLLQGRRRELLVLRQSDALAAANAEAARARRAAEDASASKSAFLANMSHELRTPLNAILGYCELLREELGERRDPLADDVARVERAGRHLLSLIDDLLDLSKIEAGRMDLELREFELPELLREVEAIARPLAEAGRNRLEVAWELPRTGMRSDERMLRQILFNLLSNACKFTREGEVRLRARLVGDDVELTVADTGVGISADGLARLFQPFVQAEQSTRRKYGGTGLGLALTRELCRLLGGSIAVDSAPGRGTTFVVRVPTRR